MKFATPLLSTLALSAFLLPAGASAAPAITGVQNNYMDTEPGSRG